MCQLVKCQKMNLILMQFACEIVTFVFIVFWHSINKTIELDYNQQISRFLMTSGLKVVKHAYPFSNCVCILNLFSDKVNYVLAEYQEGYISCPPCYISRLYWLSFFSLPFHLVNLRSCTQKFFLIIHSVSVHITPSLLVLWACQTPGSI